MYLQIVDYCNMQCAHCGFDCQPSGNAMLWETFLASMETFNQIVKIKKGFLIRQSKEELQQPIINITVGGGEPTLHPDIFKIADHLRYSINISWHMITNGKRAKIALALLEQRYPISLSQGPYHQKVYRKVKKYFEREFNKIHRYTEQDIVKAGRSKTGKLGCICPNFLIKPNGNIHHCGCKNAPVIGKVGEIVSAKIISLIKSQTYSYNSKKYCCNRY